MEHCVFTYLSKFEQIIKKSNLSPISKEMYISRLKRLVKITGKDVDWILKNADETFRIMVEDKKISELQSQKAYINSILTLFKHTNDLKNTMSESYSKWLECFRRVNSQAQMKYETCQASQKQKDVFVSWENILEKRDSLEKTSLEYLILCLYSMIPPSRADMNEIKIYSNYIPNDEEEKEFPNYLIIDGNKMTLVYNEFKSKSKKMQKYENDLPECLIDVIKTSLANDPRDFLITSPKTKKPYHNPHSYTVFVDRMLLKLFGKNVTINTLRHSFINSVDLNKLTPLEKKNLSKKLMHSTSTFDRYRYMN